jgi:HEAT repeat protein
MEFAARAGVCGDGKDVIQIGKTIIVRHVMFGHGSTNRPCDAGPVRVTVGSRDGKVVEVRTTVGGARATDATELGPVSAPAAAEYFLALAPTLHGQLAGDALLPAVLADSITAWPELLRMARDRGAATDTRTNALLWLGELAPDSALDQVEALARDDGESERVREHALIALAESHDGAGVPALVRLARGPADAWVTRKAVFWLGQAHDARARAELARIVNAASAPEELRGDAIFAMGQDNEDGESGAALRAAYPSLASSKLRDKLYQALSESHAAADADFLLGVVLNPKETLADRKQAAFWAGQGDVDVRRMTALYDRVSEPELRKHLIFVYSQESDSEATDELIRIAKSDPDPSMRKQALFWLGQKDDPRAAKLLSDILAH